MFIYCGYPNVGAAEVVINVSSCGVSPKPSGGYVSLEQALQNYPSDYCILKINILDNAEIDENYIDYCTDVWKIYRQQDIIDFEII